MIDTGSADIFVWFLESNRDGFDDKNICKYLDCHQVIQTDYWWDDQGGACL